MWPSRSCLTSSRMTLNAWPGSNVKPESSRHSTILASRLSMALRQAARTDLQAGLSMQASRAVLKRDGLCKLLDYLRKQT